MTSAQATHPDHPHLPADADVEKIDALARLLVDTRRAGAALETVGDDLLPVDAVEAQLVDDHVAAIAGWPVIGWKVGATSEPAQKMLGSPGPFAGRVYSVSDSGAQFDAKMFGAEPLIEGEFAFTMSADLPPIDRPYERDIVKAAIGAVRPSIEFVGGRFTKLAGTPLPLILADAGANIHLVLGEPVTGFDLNALPAVGATMEVAGATVGHGSGADVLGDPISVMCWLADHLSGRGITLEAGQVVTTGTATGLAPLPPGSSATVTLEGIGSASATRG